MSSFLKQTGLTLQQRLKLHTGFLVSVKAGEYASEPGLLEHVGKQFMKLTGQYFVPSSLEEISLLGFAPETKGDATVLRTTTQGTIYAQLVRTGTDFVELLVPREGRQDWLLIPLSHIVSIEKE